ncbi:hypothetical protein [Nocardiopsis coralliicola]
MDDQCAQPQMMHSREMGLMQMGSMRRRRDPTTHPVREFSLVVQEVLTTADSYNADESLEPGLERLLALAIDHPEARSGFESELVKLLDGPIEGVVEIISFLMHNLRWGRINYEIALRMKNPKDVSHIRLYKSMLDSFSDSWRDRGMYTRYSSRG